MKPCKCDLPFELNLAAEPLQEDDKEDRIAALPPPGQGLAFVLLGHPSDRASDFVDVPVLLIAFPGFDVVLLLVVLGKGQVDGEQLWHGLHGLHSLHGLQDPLLSKTGLDSLGDHPLLAFDAVLMSFCQFPAHGLQLCGQAVEDQPVFFVVFDSLVPPSPDLMALIVLQSLLISEQQLPEPL